MSQIRRFTPLHLILSRTVVKITPSAHTFFIVHRHKYNHSFNQAGGIDHVMYPQYEHAVEDINSDDDMGDDSIKKSVNKSIITIPVRLKKRLDERAVKEATKGAIRQRIVEASRMGQKSRVIISCKNQDKNHYFGQTYARGEPIPLASKGWIHKKAASMHDYFSIQPYATNFALHEEYQKVTFEDLGINKQIVEVLEKHNIKKPTVVQSTSFRRLKEGFHCCIASETGSGKTLAYLLPIFEFLLKRKEGRILSQGLNKPLVLILAPTRELAYQINEMTFKLGSELGINIKLLQGGNIGSKIANSSDGEKVDIMISTVNVITQLSEARVYELDRVQQIVLDEADTLLDDSFSPAVLYLLRKFPFNINDERRVQLTLVSATMPRSIDTILESSFPVNELERIRTPGLHRIMPHVPQKFIRLKKSEKPEKVLQIAKQSLEKKLPTMIFCNKNETVSWLSLYLMENNLPCIGLSAILRPAERKGRIDKYKNGESQILVCTDLASRGIDTPNTLHVLNYEFPHFLADYIHRCGRTGRVNGAKNGRVTSFISRIHEAEVVQEIERSVRQQTEIENVNANIKRLLTVRLSGHF